MDDTQTKPLEVGDDFYFKKKRGKVGQIARLSEDGSRMQPLKAMNDYIDDPQSQVLSHMICSIFLFSGDCHFKPPRVRKTP